jgi:sulfur carrier protein
VIPFFVKGEKAMIKVNSESLTGFEGITVTELLKQRGYKTLYVAVELNEEILPKTEYENTVLKDGDVVEVVNFVGGG